MRKQRKRRQEWAAPSFREVAQADLRLNQMSSDWLRLLMRLEEVARDWQRGITWLSSAGMIVQKQGSQLLELMAHSSRAKLGLMTQALAAAQDSNAIGSQAKWTAFWTSASGLAQSNALALGRIQTQALDSWLRLVGNHSQG